MATKKKTRKRMGTKGKKSSPKSAAWRIVRYPKNLIFTDFDGCMNSYDAGSYKTNPPETYGYSPAIIERLRKLCVDTGAMVVITSNWRKFPDDGCYTFGGSTVQNPLPKLKEALGDIVFDVLPPERYANKSECVMLWFEDNPGFSGEYAILEDDPREGFYDFTKFHGHVFMCNPVTGFTEEQAEKIRTMFES